MHKIVMKSIIPYFDYQTIRKLYPHLNDSLFLKEYRNNHDQILYEGADAYQYLLCFQAHDLNNSEPHNSETHKFANLQAYKLTDSELSRLSSLVLKAITLIREELARNQAPISVRSLVCDDKYCYPGLPQKEREKAIASNKDLSLKLGNDRMIFITKDNIDVLFNQEEEDKYIYELIKAFNLSPKKNYDNIVSKQNFYYFGNRKDNMFFIHSNLRVPYNNLCPQLQKMYPTFPGLDVDVDETDLPLLSTVEWYMRKDGERLIIYHKNHNGQEEELKYFLYSKLIADFPQYKFIIIPSISHTCMCRYMLTIFRLKTTTITKAGNIKQLSANIINQRFDKYNAMSYKTITQLFSQSIVVNGCEEIVPESYEHGFFSEVEWGTDWLTPEQRIHYNILEPHNLLPNNDCLSKRIMPRLSELNDKVTQQSYELISL